MLEQLSKLEKRYLGIKTMLDTDPKIEYIPLREYDSVTRSNRTPVYTVSQFIYKIKKKLLKLQDNVRDKKREEENRAKILLTEGLKLGPGRLKLLDLENRSLVLHYQDHYEHVCEEMKKQKIPDWQQHLLVMCKESLKMKQDIESCIFMTSLGEFEAYFVNTYILGSNLLSRLFNKAKPQSYEDSTSNITSGLNGLKKKLKKNLLDLQVETVISQTLLPTD